jgi:hypothetical protein
MPKHSSKHKDQGLVSARKGAQSTLTLTGLNPPLDLTHFSVTGDVTDSSPKTHGVWKAVRAAKGDRKNDLRLVLRCTTPPERETTPDSGILTITLTDNTNTETVTAPVDYTTDAPPP